MAHNLNSASHPDQNHTRINDTLLGAVEKKILLWLAARMPAWVVPDTLTALGLFASILIFISYALTVFNKEFLWLASLGFLIQWFGDSLDGTLARYRKIERPRYGFFVDHMIDSISEVLIFLGLGLSPFLRFDLALLALVSYMLLATYVYLVTYVNGVFRISYMRLGPTETRVLAILANTWVFFASNPTVRLFKNGPAFLSISLTYYDLVAIFFTGLVTAFFIINSISTAASLSHEDRLAAREKALQEKVSRHEALRDQRATRKAAANAARARASGIKAAAQAKSTTSEIVVKAAGSVVHPPTAASPSNIEIDQ
jgi:archaetidylinositol phosphate synthase